jgi:hypothetical protein
MLILQRAKQIWFGKRAKTHADGGAMKQRVREEQYSVIIASETDVRKKTLGFVISRKALIAAASAAVVVVAAIAVFTVMSVVNASHYSAKANELKNRITNQSSVVDT